MNLFTIYSQNYLGGDSDGHTVATYIETQSIFAGGNADGFSVSNYTEMQNIFAGGDADGFSVSNYTENQSIFAGGDADGFSVSNYTENQNIFAGGDADGFSVSNYTENQSIFAGGDADGFSVSNYTETQNIFAGGDADGFSMGSIDVNPQCSDIVSIWELGTWSNGIPDATTQVMVKSPYETQINGNLEACFLLVENTSNFIISSNTYSRIVQDLINNGNIEVQHQGSFIQVNNNATVTGTGTFTTRIQTTQLDDSSRFTYFSSPVQNQNLTVFSSWARMNRLWRFDEAIQDWYIVNQNEVMIPAVGYAIQGDVDSGQYPFTGYANFNGAFNNGIYTYPLTYNPGGIDDDNALVGNPYPSAIDAAQLLNNNPSANAFYFWTHASAILPDGSAYAGDDYAIWNNSGGIASASGSPAPTGFIASGQGFFVDATASGTITFDNSIRVTGNNTDFRKPNTENRERIWLNLEQEDYGVFNQILLNFNENGTTDFDVKLDATRFYTYNAISFYSKGINQEHFAIQALPLLTEDTVVPLGFEVNNPTINHLKIVIDHNEINTNTTVYLKDNQEKVLHNLSDSAYGFTTSEGNYTNRFELVFRRNALNNPQEITNTESLLVSNFSENEIKINTKNGTNYTQIRIFDILGKEIIHQKQLLTNHSILKTGIKQGTVLFIKVQLENGKILMKKFIKI